MISEKIPQTLLCRFYRWVKEHSPQEWFRDLRDWITEESEYQVKASETAKGLAAKGRIKREDRRSNSEAFTTFQSKCGVSQGNHPMKSCEKLKSMSVVDCLKVVKGHTTMLWLFGEQSPRDKL